MERQTDVEAINAAAGTPDGPSPTNAVLDDIARAVNRAAESLPITPEVAAAMAIVAFEAYERGYDAGKAEAVTA